MYNVVGGIVWVVSLTCAGYFFGNIPVVRKNFEFVIIAIVLISVMPIVIEAWKMRRQGKRARAEAETAPL